MSVDVFESVLSVEGGIRGGGYGVGGRWFMCVG